MLFLPFGSRGFNYKQDLVPSGRLSLWALGWGCFRFETEALDNQYILSRQGLNIVINILLAECNVKSTADNRTTV